MKSFCRVAEALNNEERQAILALLMMSSPYTARSLAEIVRVTGIEAADIHLAMLEKAGLIRTRIGKKEEILYETNYVWGRLLAEWLKFRKDECQKAGRRLGYYP